MGKRKESVAEEVEDELFSDSPSSSTHKKHKKHKKKHKRKKELEASESISTEVTPKPAIKLKLKIGGETLGTKNITHVKPSKKESSDESSEAIDILDDTWNTEGKTPEGGDKKKKGKSEDHEEKEWLDALERGDLDDSGMLKKDKDPKLLTARQRALLHGEPEAELLQLPSGYKQVELTEEQVLKRQQRAKKRRLEAHEKREKDKKQTLDRLLKKQESKRKGKGSKKSNVPKYRYTNKSSGIFLSVPQEYPFPFKATKAEPPKASVSCGVTGCKNIKKYSCSKTGVPLCSLGCYKKNMIKHGNVNMVAVT